MQTLVTLLPFVFELSSKTTGGQNDPPPPTRAKANIEVTSEVKIRSKDKIRPFDVLALGTGNIDYQGSNSGKMLSYEWLRYAVSIGRMLRKG